MTSVVQTPPGWYRDPGGRHEYRYWEGSGWTQFVADRGQTGQEPAPPGAPPPAPTVSPPPPPGAGTAPAPAEAPAAAATEGFKSRFAPDEWELVLSIPFLFFGTVAGSDNEISPAETKVLQERMTSGAFGYKDPLHREVALEILSTAVTAESLVQKVVAAGGPARVREVLRSKLTPDEYQGYVGSVWLDALAVAGAEGGISDKEQEALNTDAVFFGLDLEALKGRFQ